MEEGETLVNDIGKFVKKSEFYQINIHTKQRDILIDHKNIEFLKSENVLEQINKIVSLFSIFTIFIKVFMCLSMNFLAYSTAI